MFRAQLFQLRLNRKQAAFMARSAGSARFVYNWALAEWKRQAAAWWESDGVEHLGLLEHHPHVVLDPARRGALLPPRDHLPGNSKAFLGFGKGHGWEAAKGGEACQ